MTSVNEPTYSTLALESFIDAGLTQRVADPGEVVEAVGHPRMPCTERREDEIRGGQGYRRTSYRIVWVSVQ